MKCKHCNRAYSAHCGYCSACPGGGHSNSCPKDPDNRAAARARRRR